MRHIDGPTAAVTSGRLTTREESVMGPRKSARVFISVVLAAATLLAALEVKYARGVAPASKPDAPWLTPLQEMDSAIARADVMAAATAQHLAYRAALESRKWEGLLAVGDATLRLGEVTQSPRLAGPEVRRLYLTALFRARAANSLDGVLQTTEAFAQLGDAQVVEQGLNLARDLAGPDPEAQARVRALASRLSRGTQAAAAHVEQGRPEEQP